MKNGKRRRKELGIGRVKRKAMRKHTNTTRCYVSSNHDGAVSSLELVENPIALVLLLVSVNG